MPFWRRSQANARYQLVLQWPADAVGDFDLMLEVEDQVIELLPPQDDLDGHDFGSGTLNMFIWAMDPGAAWEAIRGGQLSLPVSEARVAFREENSDEFEVLSPPGLQHFDVI